MITAKTAVVTTGDVVHYGSGYSLQEVMAGMPTDTDDLKKTLKAELEKALTLAIVRREYQRVFPKLDKFLNNDQRYLLPVIAEILGEEADYNIISFELSDYSSINDAAAPCVVTSSLVAYGTGELSAEKRGHEQ